MYRLKGAEFCQLGGGCDTSSNSRRLGQDLPCNSVQLQLIQVIMASCEHFLHNMLLKYSLFSDELFYNVTIYTSQCKDTLPVHRGQFKIMPDHIGILLKSFPK